MPERWTTSGVDLHLDLDTTAGRRAGLERALREAIQAGRLAPGEVLPSTRTLARELGIARGTVGAAYDQLTAEGYLASRHGSGTTVARIPLPAGVASVAKTRPSGSRHNLRPGQPDPTTFPAAAWLRATRHVLAAAPSEIHTLSDPRGRTELRTVLCDYLGRVRGVRARADDVVITSGYAQGLSLLTNVLAGAGVSSIAMENPGHPFHREIVRRAGLRIVPLPVDDRGATDLLTEASFADVGAVVLTPAHQYPAGATLHPSRRHAATRWAEATGGLIIEDDYDGEFRYDRQPVGAVQGMAPGQVAYAGTASKTLAPALRLGWLVLPSHLTEAVTETKCHADAHTASLGQLVLAKLIATHAYDRHVRAARLRYRRRRDLLVTRLASATPHVGVSGVAAGLHALLQFPGDGPREDEVVAQAAARGLALQPLADHWHQAAGDHYQGLIIGYSSPTEHAWPAALDTLCAVLMPKAS